MVWGSFSRNVTAVVVAAAAAGTGFARVLVTQEKALAEAFPEAAIERHTAYLTDEQAVRVEALAGSTLAGRVVPWYSARRDGQFAGTAWFDTHLVRTLPETVMIAIDASGAVSRVEVLSFDEPTEYLPKPRWFELMHGRKLDPDLAPGRGIPLVTGATLSSRAATAAVRRALALHTVLVGTEPVPREESTPRSESPPPRPPPRAEPPRQEAPPPPKPPGERR